MATAIFFVTICGNAFIVMAQREKHPHIVHIVADDIGWNDLGFANPQMKTPTIDAMVQNGIQLTHFYTHKECAPSRSSIMTGRLPFRYGYYQNPSDDGAVPTNYTMLPTVLKAHGYRTHAIGKWHCGFRTIDNTPTGRGFETFLGYWHFGEEYMDHMFPPHNTAAKCRGVDLTNASGRDLRAAMDQNGTLSTRVFLNEFKRVLASHPSDALLYVYLAFQNAHDPYEAAPPEWVAAYSKDMEPFRRNYSAIVSDLDSAMANLAEMLKISGLWNDTVILFNSDNGAELPFADQTKCEASCGTRCCGGAGNNYPLRGGKFTLFEGGIRSRTFVYSPSLFFLPNHRRGIVWTGLSHTSDIFATLAFLGGATVSPPPDLNAPPYSNGGGLGSIVDNIPTDGFNLWPALILNEPSPRKELVHQPWNIFWNHTCNEAASKDRYQPSCGSGLVVWPYKLLVGFPGDSRVVPLPSETTTKNAVNAPRGLCVSAPCLFNLKIDPSEAEDLAQKEPGIASSLMERLLALSEPQAAPQPHNSFTVEPSDAECAVVRATGAWLPWDVLSPTGSIYVV